MTKAAAIFCRTCQSPVEQPRIGRPKLYCSLRCRNEYWHSKYEGTFKRHRQWKRRRKCKQCRKWFAVKGPKHLFCSPKCHQKSRNKGPVTSHCTACGASFVSARARTHCSSRCRKTPRRTRCCSVCGNSFNLRRGNGRVKTCSRKCWNRLSTEYEKQYGASAQHRHAVRKSRENYPLWWVKDIIKRHNRTIRDIPDEFAETYRQYLILKREIRNREKQSATEKRVVRRIRQAAVGRTQRQRRQGNQQRSRENNRHRKTRAGVRRTTPRGSKNPVFR